MKTWMKVLIITLIVAVPAMALGPVLWPPAAHGPEPTSAQMLFFIFLAVMSSLVLGLGVAFLVFGFPLVQRFSGGSRPRAWAMYLAIAWLLISWWAHENLHIHIGENLQGLLYIEYGFHTTLQIAGLILAYGFIQFLRAGAGKPVSAK